MSNHMRLSKLVYYTFLDKKYLNIGNILFEKDGVFVNIEDIPDSYLMEKYGYTKDELINSITLQIEIE